MKCTPLVTRNRGAAAAAAFAAFALAGCSVASPSTATQPYDAADGVSAVLEGGIQLENMLVVGTEEGGRGLVLGSIVNGGDQATVVSFTADVPEGGNPAESRVRVPANGVLQLGESRTPVVIEQLPAGPGATISLSAATAGGGTLEFDAPIVPQTGYYASFTPPGATPAPTQTATPTPSGTGVPAGGQDSDGDLNDTGNEEDPTTAPSESATP